METEQTLNVEGLKQSVSNRARWRVACSRETPPNELRLEYSWVVGSTPSRDPVQPTGSPGKTTVGQEPFLEAATSRSH